MGTRSTNGQGMQLYKAMCCVCAAAEAGLSRTERAMAAAVVLALATAVVALDAGSLCPGCQGPAWCKEATEGCKASLCDPVCLEMVDCKVSIAGCSGWEGCPKLTREVGATSVQRALCSQAKVKLCRDSLSVCKDDYIIPWLYNSGYDGMGLDALPLPVPSCVASETLDKSELDARCNACKSAMKISFLVDGEKQCPASTNPKEKDDQMPTKEQCKAFENAGGKDCKSAVPKHKSLRERCIALTKDAKGQASSIESSFGEWACGCMGCCGKVNPACPVSVAFNSDASVAGKGDKTSELGPTTSFEIV